MWRYTQYCKEEKGNIIVIIVEVVVTIIDYSPLWDTMRERNISQYQLLKSGIDNKLLDALKKNRNITLLTVEKLCRILNCTPNDIVKFKDD